MEIHASLDIVNMFLMITSHSAVCGFVISRGPRIHAILKEKLHLPPDMQEAHAVPTA